MTKQELQEALSLQAAVIEAKEAAIQELLLKITGLETDLANQVKRTKQEEEYKDKHRKDTEALQIKLDEMHACFDEIEEVMPRYKPAKETWMPEVENPLPARFASYCRSLIK